MTDIVERLRAAATKQRDVRGDMFYANGTPDPWLEQAADLIERQAALLREAREGLKVAEMYINGSTTGKGIGRLLSATLAKLEEA